MDGPEAPVDRPRHGWLRTVVRIACLLAAVALLWPIGKHGALPLYVPALSPFVALGSSIATRSLPLAAMLGLGVGLVAIGRRRWFCRWVCPTGLCADTAGRAGRRNGLRCPRTAALGPWIVALTLAGAVAGYPLLLWLDPLSLLAGSFSIASPDATNAKWLALGLPAVLLVSFLLPSIWCARLCPLGATQDMLASLGRLIWRRFRSDEPAAGEQRGWGVARRTMLAASLGGVWALWVRRGRGEVAGPLRPPGAIDEVDFTGVCVRCGNCIRVCPPQIVEADLNNGLAGLLTPVLTFANDYCHEGCVRCTEVCPSGALVRLRKETKPAAIIGVPQVDMNICLLGDNGECSACRNHCPYEAIRYVFCEEEYTLVPKIDLAKCPGCGACEAVCPTSPQRAIVVRKRAIGV
jgi:ferredoxin